MEGPEVPKWKPAYKWVITDDKGRLWVGTSRSVRQGYAIDVFDADGFYLASVDLPFSLSEYSVPFVRGGRLYAATSDESGAPVLAAGTIIALDEN